MPIQRKRFRVLSRQWTPRKIPYEIPLTTIDAFLDENYAKLEKVLYVGWCKRIIQGKKQLFYLAATGNSGLEARKAFKTSERFGEDVWIIR